jgi:hypothetical protein
VSRKRDTGCWKLVDTKTLGSSPRSHLPQLLTVATNQARPASPTHPSEAGPSSLLDEGSSPAAPYTYARSSSRVRNLAAEKFLFQEWGPQVASCGTASALPSGICFLKPGRRAQRLTSNNNSHVRWSWFGLDARPAQNWFQESSSSPNLGFRQAPDPHPTRIHDEFLFLGISCGSGRLPIIDGQHSNWR